MYKNQSRHSHSSGIVSFAPLPSKAPQKYENPKLIWLQCFGTFGIRQTQRSVFLLQSCSSEQRVCLCQPLNGGLPRSVFEGQLRRNSIVCPTEFLRWNKSLLLLSGSSASQCTSPEGLWGWLLISQRQLEWPYIYLYWHIRSQSHKCLCFTGQCGGPSILLPFDIWVMNLDKPSSPVIKVHLRTLH